MDLKKRITEILDRAYTTDNDETQAAEEYRKSFQDEGLRKSQFVLDRINQFNAPTREELKHFVALSVGGADGSDLLALVKNTPVRRTLLLEYDNEMANQANTHTKSLIESAGGDLQIIIGDAVQQLELTVERLKKEQERGAKGLLCVFFGVLHELPRRSNDFELRQYISRLSSVFDRNLFFLSEPCLPPHTEEEIEVRVANIGEDQLTQLLKHINAHLFDNKQSVRKLSAGFVRASFRLVMEMLHKLLRFQTIPRFQHEMEERLTEFTSDEFVKAFRTTFPRAFVERTELVSEGFHDAFWSSDVELRSMSGQQLVMPFTHVRVSAISLAPVQSVTKQTVSQVFHYAESSLADVDFPTPLDNPVSDAILALRSLNWHQQGPVIIKIFNEWNWEGRTPDEAFVLGRNIYQCADGDVTRAENILGNLRRELAKIPDDQSAHILNGMFYEAYFNHEGKFRGDNLKDKHLSKLFNLEQSKKFKDCIEFIRTALEPYRICLGVLPNSTPECLIVDVKLNMAEDPPAVESIQCGGIEQLVASRKYPADPAYELSCRPIRLELFTTLLGKFWRIPEGHLDVRFDQSVSEIERIQIPEERTVRRLRM